MAGKVVAHRYNCRCKGCCAARRRERRGEQPRTPPWPAPKGGR